MLTLLRLRGRETFEAAYKPTVILFTELGKRTGYTANDIFWLTPPELHTLVRTKKLPASLSKRQKAAYLLFENKGYRVEEGKKALAFIKKELPSETTKQTKTLKGMCAYPGTVIGKARIVIAATDIETLEKGEILVTRMIIPRFSAHFHKIKAVVADEGGVTSHASIIARENKLPCVMGTKIATKLLHTGDIIEVNAEAGTVTLKN